MIGIAFDMDDVGPRILCSITHAVDEDAASDGAVGAGVASLGRCRQLERPDGSGKSLATERKPESTHARTRQTGASELDEASTIQTHRHTPLHCGGALSPRLCTPIKAHPKQTPQRQLLAAASALPTPP